MIQVFLGLGDVAELALAAGELKEDQGFIWESLGCRKQSRAGAFYGIQVVTCKCAIKPPFYILLIRLAEKLGCLFHAFPLSRLAEDFDIDREAFIAHLFALGKGFQFTQSVFHHSDFKVSLCGKDFHLVLGVVHWVFLRHFWVSRDKRSAVPQLFYRRTALALEESFFFRKRFLVSFHQHRKCVPNTRGINRESLTGVRGDWRVFDTQSLVACILLMESLAVLFETNGKHSRDLKARRSVSPFPWLLRTPKNAVQTARRRYVSSSGLARPRSFPEFLTSICAGYQ